MSYVIVVKLDTHSADVFTFPPETVAWLFHLIGDKAPPAVRDSSEVARA